MNQNPMGNNPGNFNNTQNPYGQNVPPQGGVQNNPNPAYPVYPQMGKPHGAFPQPGMPGQGQPGKAPQRKNMKAKSKKSRAVDNTKWVLLGILMMLVLVAGGAFLGYRTAVNARIREYDSKIVSVTTEQYQLALSDINEGNLSIAKERLEYILRVNSNFPGATETYQEVMIALAPKATPTPAMTSTPEPTATVDLRGEEEMYQGVVNLMYAQDWQGALDQMDALRDKNLAYKGLAVDGLYYIALRNLGMQEINQGYLESGVYKITLSGSFGPVDKDADALRTAARSYLAGAGFWEIDWNKALEYYSNAYVSYPNMFDRATSLTAQERYIEASFEVGNLYVISQDYCAAIPYYEQGLLLSANEAQAATATAVYLGCYPPTDVPVVTYDEPVVETDPSGAAEPVVEEPIVEEQTTPPDVEEPVVEEAY